MNELADSRCFVTTDGVVIDGANGVCRDVRVHHGEALGFAGLGLLILAVAWVLWFARKWGDRRARALALVGLGALGALFGGWQVVTVRADRPTHVMAPVRDVTRLHDRIRWFARAHGGAHVRTAHCLACEPICRLALVDLNGSTPIDLYSDALETGCVTSGGALRCGTAP